MSVLETSELDLALVHARNCIAFEVAVFVVTPTGGMLYWTTTFPETFNTPALGHACSERPRPKTTMEWIESDGGPLVVLPRSAVSTWQGTDTKDYEEACGVEDYLGRLPREWGEVVVLGDEPFRTGVLLRSDGVAIVRWRYAASEEELLTSAREADLDLLHPVETLAVTLLDEPYVILDSATHGSRAKTIEFSPPPGTRLLQTYVVEDAEHKTSMILHRFA